MEKAKDKMFEQHPQSLILRKVYDSKDKPTGRDLASWGLRTYHVSVCEMPEV